MPTPIGQRFHCFEIQSHQGFQLDQKKHIRYQQLVQHKLPPFPELKLEKEKLYKKEHCIECKFAKITLMKRFHGHPTSPKDNNQVLSGHFARIKRLPNRTLKRKLQVEDMLMSSAQVIKQQVMLLGLAVIIII